MGNGVIRRNTDKEDFALDMQLAFNDVMLDSDKTLRPTKLVSFDDALENFDGIQEQMVGENWEAHESR